MELPNDLLEQLAFKRRPKIEEHMLIVMDKSTHEGHLAQPLQTNNQFKIAITFLSGYNGFINVTNENNKFIFISVFEGVEHNVIELDPGAYDLESLNAEIKRVIIDKGFIKEEVYPGTIKPIFSISGSIIEIEPGRGLQLIFVL